MAAEAPARRGSARTKARKRALDILFEADLRDVPVAQVLSLHVAEADPPVRPFTTELVEGVVANRSTIDQSIAESLPSAWTLERMPRVDRNLARIAIYEIRHTDLPAEVAVAECVGLSEQLSTDESPAFLNGLLRNVVSRGVAGTA